MSDLDFIPTPRAGPLDKYRVTASFDWRKLKIALDGDLHRLRLKHRIWNILESEPLFSRTSCTLTTDELKRRTALQLDKFIKYEFALKSAKEVDEKARILHLSAVNEAIRSVNPNVAVKVGIGIYLFSNILLHLGTDKHRPFYDAVRNGEVLGTVASTEVAHGSNIKALRTTATFDPKTKEFIMNTPDFEAAKCWMGNLGKSCTYSLVFAQLYTPNDTCHGLHMFLVPIRNPKTLFPFPGIIVGDIGEKTGLNGVDNGFMMFENYRIPKDNLLNRFGDVTEDGKYESNLTNPSRMIGAFLVNFTTPRVAIMSESAQTLSFGITIAIRYSALRKQFGNDGNEETPLIEYQLHQWRLFPYMAACVIFKLFARKTTSVYLDALQKVNDVDNFEETKRIVSEIHAIISACKPLITWTTSRALQECREACGGHGYLKAANLGELMNDHEPSVTYEGDNNVLGQQTSNWLLQQWSNFHSQNVLVESPLNAISFINNSSSILIKTFVPETVADIANEEFVLTSYEWLICWLLKTTSEKFERNLSSGKTKFTARNDCQVYNASILSKVFSEYVALFFSLKIISGLEKELQPVLHKLYMLHALNSLEKHLIYFYQGGYTNSSKFADFVREYILILCTEIKPEAISIVDALAPPDFVLNSVLGHSNGLVYQNLQNNIFHATGTMERPSWWNDITKSKL